MNVILIVDTPSVLAAKLRQSSPGRQAPGGVFSRIGVRFDGINHNGHAISRRKKLRTNPTGRVPWCGVTTTLPSPSSARLASSYLDERHPRLRPPAFHSVPYGFVIIVEYTTDRVEV
jgi:hypothetical protein